MGPSTCWFNPGWVNTVDGVTAKRATWPWRMAVGARYADSMRNTAVSIRVGEKWVAVAFGRSASMIVDDVSNVKGRQDARRLKKSRRHVVLKGWLVGLQTEKVDVEVMRVYELTGLILGSGHPRDKSSAPSEAHNVTAEVVVVICYLTDAIVLSYFRSKALLFNCSTATQKVGLGHQEDSEFTMFTERPEYH